MFLQAYGLGFRPAFGDEAGSAAVRGEKVDRVRPREHQVTAVVDGAAAHGGAAVVQHRLQARIHVFYQGLLTEG